MRVTKVLLLVLVATCVMLAVVRAQGFPDAPSGFDGLTNGFVNQTEFRRARLVFEERESIESGLGPVYNAQSCAECHQNPVTGGISQISELRAGHLEGSTFMNHPGGSLIHSRATDASIQEYVMPGYEIRTFRTSLNTLGDGYVECLDDLTLINLAASQPQSMQGQVVMVPVLEAGGALRAGRFGWKNQHASLVSFSADAYLNEVGITSTLAPTENTSNGNPVDVFDGVPDPEDSGGDVEAFAKFMRATKAPPRYLALAATPEAEAGERLFTSIGCATCHVSSLVTASPGTPINGGTFVVPAALGNKVIHPFGDFLLHDVGTGDGIVQNGGPSTRNKLRTAPLWGVRTRNRLMHDGESLSIGAAILRHAGEAASVTAAYRGLSPVLKAQLITFLMSL